MIKLTVAIVVLLIAGGIWIRAQWARSKNSNAAREIIDSLTSGKYVIESYQEALNILICTKRIERLDIPKIKTQLQSLAGKKLSAVFNIDYADISAEENSIIIGEGKGVEVVDERKMEIHFPCWLYIQPDVEGKKLLFKSTFPESKDHHHLLEDLSDELFNKCYNV